jgi:hypothetical protein
MPTTGSITSKEGMKEKKARHDEKYPKGASSKILTLVTLN